jgi:His/Glu/Gln/Arg/opine family amino acid ABC transporter permease subunit
MVSEQAVRPSRGLTWARHESRPVAVASAAVGGAALALVIFGTVIVVAVHGLVPWTSVADALSSPALRLEAGVAIALGVVAMALGWGTYRRMPTRLSREEAVAGAVLGAQAALLGAALLWFSQTDVRKFALNFANFEQIQDQIGAFLTGAKNTIFLAAGGEFIGIVLGLVLVLLSISHRAVVRAPARVYINFFRGTPLIWQLSFIGLAVPLALSYPIPAYTAALIAFSLNTGAYSAEVFRAGLQSIERGQMEAARGLGMSYLQAMRHAILPQAVRRVIPPLMNEFVILIKDTSLVIVLGLTESQRELMSVAKVGFGDTFNATFYVATAIGYLCVSLPLIRLVNVVERRLRSGLVGVTAL